MKRIDKWSVLLGAALASTKTCEQIVNTIDIAACDNDIVKMMLNWLKQNDKQKVVDHLKSIGVEADMDTPVIDTLIQDVRHSTRKHRYKAAAEMLLSCAKLTPDKFIDTVGVLLSDLEGGDVSKEVH